MAFFYRQHSYPATNKLELWRIYYEPKSVNYLSGGRWGPMLLRGDVCRMISHVNQNLMPTYLKFSGECKDWVS